MVRNVYFTVECICGNNMVKLVSPVFHGVVCVCVVGEGCRGESLIVNLI